VLQRQASCAARRASQRARCRSMTSTKVSPSDASSGVDPSTSVKSSVAIRGDCIGVRAGAAGGRPHLRRHHQPSRSRAQWVKLGFRHGSRVVRLTEQAGARTTSGAVAALPPVREAETPGWRCVVTERRAGRCAGRTGGSGEARKTSLSPLSSTTTNKVACGDTILLKGGSTQTSARGGAWTASANVASAGMPGESRRKAGRPGG
jgi:hypothetical protein